MSAAGSGMPAAGSLCLYDVLGLKRAPAPTPADIRKAYLASCRQWHPDRWVQRSEEAGKRAEVLFKLIVEANSVLSDPHLRRASARSRPARTGGTAGSDPGVQGTSAHPTPPTASRSRARPLHSMMHVAG